MKFIATTVLLVFSCAGACAQTAQKIAPPPNENEVLAARFDPLVEQALKEDPLPGFAVGIVRHGQLLYARGFGVQRLGEPKAPITPQTLFHEASITKTFVATSVMQLWERGKVDLDAPVTKYVPYFRIDDPRYAKITVRQMLSHSSGMPDVEDYEWSKPQTDDGALERYVRSLAGMKLKLLFEPGTGFSYSNMAYEVLGDLVSKVSGMTFEDYVEKNILEPLGMKTSTLLLTKADAKLLAEGYEKPRGGDFASLRKVKAYPFNRAHSPSSDLMSNVVDMSRWAIANLRGGHLEGVSIVSQATHDLMWTPAAQVERCHPNHTGCEKTATRVGMSWFMEERDGHKIYYHAGGDDGFLTMLLLDPDADMALIWMANAAYPGMQVSRSVGAEFRKLAQEADVERAKDAVYTLNTVELSYLRSYNVGYACALKQLGGQGIYANTTPESAGLINDELAAGKAGKYTVTLSCDQSRPAKGYRVAAVPSPELKGLPAICSDETGIVRSSDDGKAESCFASGKWSDR